MRKMNRLKMNVGIIAIFVGTTAWVFGGMACVISEIPAYIPLLGFAVMLGGINLILYSRTQYDEYDLYTEEDLLCSVEEEA